MFGFIALVTGGKIAQHNFVEQTRNMKLLEIHHANLPGGCDMLVGAIIPRLDTTRCLLMGTSKRIFSVLYSLIII